MDQKQQPCIWRSDVFLAAQLPIHRRRNREPATSAPSGVPYRMIFRMVGFFILKIG